MADADPLTVHGGMLEALQSQPGVSRRARPPDIDVVTAEGNRVPLRPEKANRRESRLGLRNFFTRSKTPKDPGTLTSPLRETAKSTGIRASIADMSHWPYGNSAPKSEANLAPPQISHPLPMMLEVPAPGQTSHNPHLLIGGKQRTATAIGKAPREPLGTWHPPPLFKAYPQAIKHTTLPATSLSADTVLRIHERKTNVVPREDLNEPMSPTIIESGEGAGDREKPKRRHRRNSSWSTTKFDWTNKIYILVTAGYLLQYAGEGAFDRLPEKVLQLTRNSAAFASDVIPGRHWVVQVSSAMESDGTANSDPKSLFSRFRVTERRQASNFLMVFESTADMESWITVLRREIQILGGKKSLSETGKPKIEDQVVPLKQQTSQRTLVVRDPARFSRVISNQQSWEEIEHQNSPAIRTEAEAVRDRSLDDISTTNSVTSHDGRQLDNLRDSSNRLSFISSGQRTMVTSTGSSPACSPTVESFPPHLDDATLREAHKNHLEARPRPNASAILDRRQSMQTLGPFVDVGSSTAAARPSILPSGLSIDPPNGATSRIASPKATPNFSVPQSSSRRFSYVKNPHEVANAKNQPVIKEGEVFHRSTRKKPPTKLPLTRPLSLVADQPSPMEEVPERPATRHGESQQLRSPTGFEAIPLPRMPKLYEIPSRQSSRQPTTGDSQAETQVPQSPRRFSGLRMLRSSERPTMVRSFTAPNKPVPVPKMRSHPSLPRVEDLERCRSSLDVHGNPRSSSPSAKARSLKRNSIQSIMSEKSFQSKHPSDFPLPYIAEPLPQPAPPPSAPLPPIPTSASNPHLKVDLGDRGLFNRRSMPHLNEGPPPAPPPTCALPPIPQKTATKP